MQAKELIDKFTEEETDWNRESFAEYCYWSRESFADYCYKAGIKEVVEWLETKPIFIIRTDRNLNDVSRSLAGNSEWQAKLKEWGIEG